MRRGYMPEKITSGIALFGTAITLGGLVGGVTWGQGEIIKASYSANDAKEYVKSNGYKDVKLEDIDTILVGARGCDQKDGASYEFSAEAPSGVEVDVLVCKGLLKSATLRQG